MQFLKMEVITLGEYLKYISFSIKNIYLFSKNKNWFQLKSIFQMIGDIEKGGKWKNKCLCYYQ